MKKNNYKYLKDKWTKKHQELQSNLAEKHKKSFNWLSENSKQLTVSSIGGLMLLTTPLQHNAINVNNNNVRVAAEEAQTIDKSAFLIADLSGSLPDQMRPLTTEEETKISAVLSKNFGMTVAPEVNGLRLNRSYGLIGAEQHLARFPGDNMATHFDPPAGGESDSSAYFSSGMAPGLGAFGYFATSQSQMTKEDVDREKYYIAVQTFLSPDFNNKVAEYRDFYKYRKMLVVNPQNGKAVVADIADAGPAEWTGKHLGGSPEVMKYLERVDGAGRGPVLYFFIDDKNDTIPLGPVQTVQ